MCISHYFSDDFVFEIGSLVGVMLPPETVGSGRPGSESVGTMAYGVVRWTGYINDEPMLGLEMDDYGFQSGYLHDAWYFECEQGKGLFARPEQCVPDERIQQMALLDETPHHDAHDNQLLVRESLIDNVGLFTEQHVVNHQRLSE